MFRHQAFHIWINQLFQGVDHLVVNQKSRKKSHKEYSAVYHYPPLWWLEPQKSIQKPYKLQLNANIFKTSSTPPFPPEFHHHFSRLIGGPCGNHCCKVASPLAILLDHPFVPSCPQRFHPVLHKGVVENEECQGLAANTPLKKMPSSSPIIGKPY